MKWRVLGHPESGEYWVGDPDALTWDDWARGVVEVDPCTLPAGTRIKTTLHHSDVLPSFDFETYSEAGFRIDRETGKVRGMAPDGKGGLPVVGTPVYAEHPSTEILSLAYDLKDGRGPRLWLPGAPDPLDLLDYIRSGGLIEAWNVTFEFWIWNMVAVRRLGWPTLRMSQCRCAMAKSRRFSMPGKLDVAAKVLGTARKHKEGTALIQKLTRPHTPTRERRAFRWTPATAWSDFVKLYDYNVGDIVAEDSAAALIPDLTPWELSVWQMDQTINARGVQVDVGTLDAALDVLGQVEARFTQELVALTAGAVGTVNEVESLGDWLRTQGVDLPDIKKDTVAAALADQRVQGPARRALEIRSVLGAANVKKLRSLKLQVSSDGRLRDQYTYCGADQTGRWSAGGVQLQNMTAAGPDTNICEGCEKSFGQDCMARDAYGAKCCPRCGSTMYHAAVEWGIVHVRQAIEDVRTRSLDFILFVWGDPVALLCGILRGLFIARPGYKLICVDFSAIEAVAAACLARCQWRIDVFSTHGKIYEASAANATGIPFEEIVGHKKKHGTHHPARKGVGKIRELAGGYGGWIGAWKNFGADDYFPDDKAIKADCLKWRAESPEIVEMWGGQYRETAPGSWEWRPELYGLEGAAIAAIQNPGTCYSHIDITYGVRDDILFARLPSGRFLHYHRPRLVPVADRLKRGPSLQVAFEGYNSNSQKGPVGWIVKDTFGGRLFENKDQAVSADIQAAALLRCEAGGYSIVMHTHDEGVAEVPDSPEWSVEGMTALMVQREPWFAWWPIRGAGWEDDRYQKD